MNIQKVGGVIVFLIGIPLGLLAPDRFLASVAASTGLMMIFFAKERIDDERVQQLKMKAMFAAMSSGIGLTLITYNTAFMVIRGVSASRPEMSAFEFLAGVLVIALALFHYWRWQDARPDRHADLEDVR